MLGQSPVDKTLSLTILIGCLIPGKLVTALESLLVVAQSEWVLQADVPLALPKLILGMRSCNLILGCHLVQSPEILILW